MIGWLRVRDPAGAVVRPGAGVYDMEWAYTLWGYLGGARHELVAWRDGLFRGAAEDYWVQRRIADAVRPETLPLTPAAGP